MLGSGDIGIDHIAGFEGKIFVPIGVFVLALILIAAIAAFAIFKTVIVGVGIFAARHLFNGFIAADIALLVLHRHFGDGMGRIIDLKAIDQFHPFIQNGKLMLMIAVAAEDAGGAAFKFMVSRIGSAGGDQGFGSEIAAVFAEFHFPDIEGFKVGFGVNAFEYLVAFIRVRYDAVIAIGGIGRAADTFAVFIGMIFPCA